MKYKKLDTQMIVHFRRTGQRRYAVQVKRSSFPDLVMDPAPGYDDLMPHDLLHFVVEAQLGLTRGIFGQLAAGGDAGTFHPTFKPGESSREFARLRNRLRERGEKLKREGREDCAQSERATYICWYEWHARSQSGKRRNVALPMSEEAGQVRDVSPRTELRALNGVKLTEICKHLDELSSHWSRLKVGESIMVSWPDLNVSSDPELFSAESHREKLSQSHKHHDQTRNYA